MLKNSSFRKNGLSLFTNTICNLSNWQEIRIPVPWGHLAGKWWGPQDQRPILTTHGWQDNSGSFDTLIPLLPKTTSFLAIDFPGCGYSSHVPPGVFSHPIDLVILIRRIVKYFKWPKVSLLGHSMGAGANYAYAMYYPNEVEFLIGLDYLKPVVEDKTIDELSRDLDIFLKFDNYLISKMKPPMQTLPVLEQKLHKSFNSVAIDKCRYILERNVEVSATESDKFCSRTDPRLKIFSLVDFSHQDLINNAHRVTCPIFYLKTDKGPYFEKKEYIRDFINEIRKHNKNLEVHYAEGTHHVHLNNPELVESAINKFLKKYDIGDKSYSGLNKENLV